MSTSSRWRVLLAGPLALAVLAGCSTNTDAELETFAGEWCTLEGLGSSNLPRTADRYVGMVLLEEGGTLVGSGSTKWPGSDVLYASRYHGTYTGTRAALSVSDLDPLADPKGPVFDLELTRTGPRDLEGTISGDSRMAGPITLVRLGPRCFYQ